VLNFNSNTAENLIFTIIFSTEKIPLVHNTLDLLT
jgi:hypothetical protein